MKGDFQRVVDLVEKMDDYDMMISGVHTRPLSTQQTSSKTSPKDTTSLNWSTMTWFGNVSEDLKECEWVTCNQQINAADHVVFDPSEFSKL